MFLSFLWFCTLKNSLSIFAFFYWTCCFVHTLLLDKTLAIAIVLVMGLSILFGLERKKRRKRLLSIILTIAMASAFVQSVEFVFENVFEQRHRDRFNIVLGREVDTQGIGYNINQSQIAIGSGGFLKRVLEGTQTKGNFIPEQQTDYIFTTVGEEWGFVGSVLVVVFYITLMLRVLITSRRQKIILVESTATLSFVFCLPILALTSVWF